MIINCTFRQKQYNHRLFYYIELYDSNNLLYSALKNINDFIILDVVNQTTESIIYELKYLRWDMI